MKSKEYSHDLPYDIICVQVLIESSLVAQQHVFAIL